MFCFASFRSLSRLLRNFTASASFSNALPTTQNHFCTSAPEITLHISLKMLPHTPYYLCPRLRTPLSSQFRIWVHRVHSLSRRNSDPTLRVNIRPLPLHAKKPTLHRIGSVLPFYNKPHRSIFKEARPCNVIMPSFRCRCGTACLRNGYGRHRRTLCVAPHRSSLRWR